MSPRPRRQAPSLKASSSEERYRGMGPRGVSKTVTRATLERYFDRPLDEAGRALGVSTTIVKRLCRKMGITRWPFRQICSVNKALSKIHEMIKNAKTPCDAEKLQERVRYLEEQRRLLFREPAPLSLYDKAFAGIEDPDGMDEDNSFNLPSAVSKSSQYRSDNCTEVNERVSCWGDSKAPIGSESFEQYNTLKRMPAEPGCGYWGGWGDIAGGSARRSKTSSLTSTTTVMVSEDPVENSVVAGWDGWDTWGGQGCGALLGQGEGLQVSGKDLHQHGTNNRGSIMRSPGFSPVRASPPQLQPRSVAPTFNVANGGCFNFDDFRGESQFSTECRPKMDTPNLILTSSSSRRDDGHVSPLEQAQGIDVMLKAHHGDCSSGCHVGIDGVSVHNTGVVGTPSRSVTGDSVCSAVDGDLSPIVSTHVLPNDNQVHRGRALEHHKAGRLNSLSVLPGSKVCQQQCFGSYKVVGNRASDASAIASGVGKVGTMPTDPLLFPQQPLWELMIPLQDMESTSPAPPQQDSRDWEVQGETARGSGGYPLTEDGYPFTEGGWISPTMLAATECWDFFLDAPNTATALVGEIW